MPLGGAARLHRQARLELVDRETFLTAAVFQLSRLETREVEINSQPIGNRYVVVGVDFASIQSLPPPLSYPSRSPTLSPPSYRSPPLPLESNSASNKREIDIANQT